MSTHFSSTIDMTPIYEYYIQSLWHTWFSNSVAIKQNKYKTPKTKRYGLKFILNYCK